MSKERAQAQRHLLTNTPMTCILEVYLQTDLNTSSCKHLSQLNARRDTPCPNLPNITYPPAKTKCSNQSARRYELRRPHRRKPTVTFGLAAPYAPTTWTKRCRAWRAQRSG